VLRSPCIASALRSRKVDVLLRFRSKVFVVACVALVIAAAAGYFAAQRLRQPIVESVAIHLAQRDVTSAFHKRRLNFLVLGTQEDEGTTDTVILAHLDLDRRIATLISVPRDAWVPIPGHGHQKINAAYAYGGGPLTARLVGNLTGAHVDATIAIDPSGAKQIVDAMGGLNIDVERDMDYDDNFGNLHIHLKKGEQFLGGGGVLEYMRFRHDSESDFGRMRRQQQVLHEIVRELGAPQNWPKIPRLIALARKDVRTPLSDAQLQALVELYRGVPADNIRTLTLPGRADFVGDASVVLVDDWWAKIIGSLVCAPQDPPPGVVIVANATGVPSISATVVSALRGGGWDVRTSIDEPATLLSVVTGSGLAAQRLASMFSTFERRPGKETVLKLGTSAIPKM